MERQALDALHRIEGGQAQRRYCSHRWDGGSRRLPEDRLGTLHGPREALDVLARRTELARQEVGGGGDGVHISGGGVGVLDGGRDRRGSTVQGLSGALDLLQVSQGRPGHLGADSGAGAVQGLHSGLVGLQDAESLIVG